MSSDRAPGYRGTVEAQVRHYGPPPLQYMKDSNPFFERIAGWDGVFNRVLMYRGNTLHSGLIPDWFRFPRNPRKGRLTMNALVTV
ncbi:hypothetical protein GCM10011342_04710 [Aquisalinus flavus]|uniref:Uncharacterized protein n=1 Tax=Aquisalinus flavus TaxID=1526572 RepID=A0A8J2Y667_9PROT|nr:hypothetical protein [Aquisalinus flavus]UNE46976.1 hypothetical protein FF099_02345 [Aquisalinus flavus]GGC98822.1 hypothetical protein GCM10011342_04710 [Aquisalinus flavus]